MHVLDDLGPGCGEKIDRGLAWVRPEAVCEGVRATAGKSRASEPNVPTEWMGGGARLKIREAPPWPTRCVG